MTCPVCDGKTRVFESRPDLESVRRRRECIDCGYRFHTVELDADLWEKMQQKTEAPAKPFRFSAEYDPGTGKLRLIEEKEAKG